MYAEDAEPHAVNFYAETKIRAGHAARQTATPSVVARLSLVYALCFLSMAGYTPQQSCYARKLPSPACV